MKSNLLQSQLHRNALVITLLTKQLCESKADAKVAQLEASRKFAVGNLLKLRKKVIRLAEIQKGIKADLLAQKLAKVSRRKKHGKDDARYTQWLTKQEGIGVATPIPFFPPADTGATCGC